MYISLQSSDNLIRVRPPQWMNISNRWLKGIDQTCSDEQEGEEHITNPCSTSIVYLLTLTHVHTQGRKKEEVWIPKHCNPNQPKPSHHDVPKYSAKASNKSKTVPVPKQLVLSIKFLGWRYLSPKKSVRLRPPKCRMYWLSIKHHQHQHHHHQHHQHRQFLRFFFRSVLGDKIAAGILAQTAGVPSIPWSGDGLTAELTSEGTIPDSTFKMPGPEDGEDPGPLPLEKVYTPEN